MMRAINPSGPLIPGISQAMLIEKGHLLFLSGHVPISSDGTIAEKSISTQLKQVFENLHATLMAAEVDFTAVVRLTIYVRDYHPDFLPTIRTIRDQWINPECPPASALIGVASLFHPDALVEIDAIAIVSKT